MDCAIVLPAISRITKKTMAAMAERMAPVSPIWCANDCASAFSVVVFVSSGRVLELRVDGVRDLVGASRIVDLEDVPADGARVADTLHQVVVVEEESGLVDVRRLPLVDADEIELVGLGLAVGGTIVRRLDGDAVAVLPAVALGELPSRDGSRPRLQPCGLLLLGRTYSG
jgi:hypothetical protein